MKEIGGYLSLELQNRNRFPHSEGVLLNTGRNALEYILRTLQIVKKLYIPYFTCHTVLQPVKLLGIPYEFYHVNENLEISQEIRLSDNEFLLYTNYYGIKDEYVRRISDEYKEYLIVDNAQALFASHTDVAKCFFTPHKFVGLPDGGIAFSDHSISLDNMETDISCYRCGHLFVRFDELAIKGYDLYKTNSRQSRNQPMRKMSHLTETLLQNIDFEEVRKKRIENFNYLHNKLGRRNRFFTGFQEIGPMVYPYRTNNRALRDVLIGNHVFVARYWPNVLEWCSPSDIDYQLAESIIPLPIDQRYGKDEMDFIINLILKYE